ncbi:hypothetical protein CLV63_103156 [Murinocardiopsis flavida]|uniref:DUF309 family protein family protein n=1 Tax=Murinocardiopsis flavida TaxID=645275 RepID=A0A2P8DQE7_9ACTN|nr:DUF309 domain-containing protein [Murinocardiopsis flavida]PSK99431.1 hypothetical protein CLV63_103156 [Murinocardiopsis flavida]
MDAEGAAGSAARDRDPSGRAQNQRPRDRLGRPLPHGAEGVPRIPDDAVFTPQEGLARAQELLDDGYAFHAHEVLEAVWKAAPESEREMWRGLAQVAVGLTHAQRGNAEGAARLLRRGADRISDYGAGAPHGVDVLGVAAAGREAAAAVEGAPGAAVDPARIRLRRAG